MSSKRKQHEKEVSLNDLAALINEFKYEITEKFNKLETALNSKICDIEKSLTHALEIGAEQGVKIDSLEEQCQAQDTKIKHLTDIIDDLQNRALRETLIFKNVPMNREESTWAHTKNVLADTISEITKFDKALVYKSIDRAHRGKSNGKTTPHIFVKFTSWSTMEDVKSIIQESSRDTHIYASNMYSPSLTARRNDAMLHRKTLKSNEPCIKAYVKYPATLMVQRPGNSHYQLEKVF